MLLAARLLACYLLLFNKEIARELGTTERTTKAHRLHVMEKLQLHVTGRAL